MNKYLTILMLGLIAFAGRSAPSLGFEPPGLHEHGLALDCVAIQNSYEKRIVGQRPLAVEIRRHGNGFKVYRGGEPYFIKGIGGRRFLESAATAGANSVRTWGAQDGADLLDRAQGLNMTVMLGIWLSHQPADYHEPSYKESKTEEIQRLVLRHRKHPALLAWSLGNEINLEGADTEAAWRFVNHLARLIKALDPQHPVIAIIACREGTLDKIAAFAPALDAVGINAYGALTHLRVMVDHSAYTGPYLITEWGVPGHWEVQHTSWGRPIEPTSAWKAEYQLLRYRNDILANSDRCIGSYIFLWGQKQERTPTWYSMIVADLPVIQAGGLAGPRADAMHFNWTGNWPVNRAPKVLSISINGNPADRDITLLPGEPMVSRTQVRDPENDRLTYLWELLEEPAVLGSGGSHEPRPRTLSSVRQDNSPVLNLKAPLLPGEYRLFVYVLDHNGHAGTANIPFQVRGLADERQRL